MNKKQIVITGIGIVSPIGIGKEEFWDSCSDGVSGIGNIEAFDSSRFKTKVSGEVKAAYGNETEERFAAFASAAGVMALEDAGLWPYNYDPMRTGICVGSCLGAMLIPEEQIVKIQKRLMGDGTTLFSERIASHVLADLVGACGPVLTTSTACSSSNQAISQAVNLLRLGIADIMISGGVEAPVLPIMTAGFCSSRTTTTLKENPAEASRPFDKERKGFVIGEGAAIIILETLECATKRGAYVYCEILGSGTSCDAYHMVQPAPDNKGTTKAMMDALIDSGIQPEEVEYINAHGTSTILNDRLETASIKTVFGKNAYRIPISSTKSMVGHLIGASGAIELVASILTLEKGIIPPTINLREPDPECDLNYVPNVAIKKKVKTILSNSFGFGGNNCSIVLRKI